MNRNIQRKLFLIFAIGILFLCGCVRQGDIQPVEKESSADAKLTDISNNLLVHDSNNQESVVALYLTVRRGNKADGTDYTWDEVNSHSTDYYIEQGIDRYAVEAIVQFGNEQGLIAGEFGYGSKIPNATVQIRGAKSSKAQQKSYKISLKSNAGSWRDQMTIALNKHIADGLRFRNKLGFDLASDIPNIIALRTQFVHLYVKDETKDAPDTVFHDYGLFTQVEQPNKSFLQRQSLDRNGNLYKAVDFTFARYRDALHLETDAAFERAKFETVLESKGDNNHTKLFSLLDELADETIPIQNIFKNNFNADNYFTWLAFQILTDNVDSNKSNFYLYSSSNDHIWRFIPWDMDAILSEHETVRTKNSTLAQNRSLGFEYGLSNYWNSILHRRILSEAVYRKMLDEKIEEVYRHLSHDTVDKWVSFYRDSIKPLVYAEPDAQFASLTAEMYDEVAGKLAEEVDRAYELYRLSLQKPSPFRLKTPNREASGIKLSWEPAISFTGKEITYSVEVAKDYLFEDNIIVQSGISNTELLIDAPSEGQYFTRISAVDADGNFRYSMDRYDDVYDTTHYGIKCFYVLNDGLIIADDYYPIQY